MSLQTRTVHNKDWRSTGDYFGLPFNYYVRDKYSLIKVSFIVILLFSAMLFFEKGFIGSIGCTLFIAVLLVPFITISVYIIESVHSDVIVDVVEIPYTSPYDINAYVDEFIRCHNIDKLDISHFGAIRNSIEARNMLVNDLPLPPSVLSVVTTPNCIECEKHEGEIRLFIEIYRCKYTNKVWTIRGYLQRGDSDMLKLNYTNWR